MKKFELGITTFAEVMMNPKTQAFISYDLRIQQVIEEIILADQIGLDYYGVGEHHRKEFAASVPETILAASASVTKQIKLGSAVTVLSSDDPVRIYQHFATLNAISKGRAEISLGRGSFIESFPLFGYDLKEYDLLFSEKLELLLNIRDNEVVKFQGKTRSPIPGLGIYPRTQYPLAISIAVGGTPASAIRAAKYGLPLFLAIIGGNPTYFKGIINLYKKHYIQNGHDPEKMHISVHSHGFIMENFKQAVETYYPSIEPFMNMIGQERGWAPYTRTVYDQARSMDGALFVGDPSYVAEKIYKLKKDLGIDRFAMHVPVGYLDHELVKKAIYLLGTEVKDRLNQLILEND